MKSYEYGQHHLSEDWLYLPLLFVTHTSFQELAQGGKVIGGGPMMGRAVANLDAPVTKGTSGVLIMRGKEALRKRATACIKCAKCVAVCPMGLEPYLLSKMVYKGLAPQTEPERVTDCIECGSCAYVCPAHLPLLDRIRLGKAEVLKICRARNAK